MNVIAKQPELDRQFRKHKIIKMQRQTDVQIDREAERASERAREREGQRERKRKMKWKRIRRRRRKREREREREGGGEVRAVSPAYVLLNPMILKLRRQCLALVLTTSCTQRPSVADSRIGFRQQVPHQGGYAAQPTPLPLRRGFCPPAR